MNNGKITDVILNNPFRVLCLSVKSSDREIHKTISKYEALLSIGKNIESKGIDLNYLGIIKRDELSIKNAFQEIDNPKSRFFYSLFWFDFEQSKNDKALFHIINNNIDEAISKYRDIVNNNKISLSNISAYKNLTLLYFLRIYVNHNTLSEDIKKFLYLSTAVFNFTSFWQYYCNGNSTNIILASKNEIITKYFNLFFEELYNLTDISNETLNIILSDLVKHYIGSQINEIILNKLNCTYKNSANELFTEIKNQIKNTNDLNENNLSNFIININKNISFLSNIYKNNQITLNQIKDKASELIRIYCFELLKNDKSEKIISRIKTHLKAAIDIAGSLNAKNIAKKDFENFIEETESIYSTDIINKIVDCIKEYSNKIESNIRNYYYLGKTFYEKVAPLLIELRKTHGIENEIIYKLHNYCADLINGYAIKCFNEDNSTTQSKYLFNYALELVYDNQLKETIKNNLKRIAEIEINHYSYSPFYDNPDLFITIIFRTIVKIWKKAPIALSFISIVLIIFIFAYIADYNSSDSTTSKNNSYQLSTKDKDNSSKSKQSNYKQTPDNKSNNYYEDYPTDKKYFVRPSTGFTPYNNIYGKGNANGKYQNQLKVNNNNNSDVVVLLVNNSNNKVVRNVYIREDQSFTLRNIPNGSYYLKAFIGDDWNSKAKFKNEKIIGGFTSGIRFVKFDSSSDIMSFVQTSRKYSINEMTLYTLTSSYPGGYNEVSENTFFEE